MKAKLLSGIVVIFVMLTGSAIADKSHHQENDSGESTSGMMKTDGTPMMDMGAMKAHMKKMQQIMDQIENTRDVKKRRALMQQHMKEMHQGMGMMKGMMSGSMGDKGMQHKMAGKMADHGAAGKMKGGEGMMNRHRMMEQRMDMMQGMMGQMMEHMMRQQQMEMKKK